MARILIIDDDQAFRESLAETLQDLGHDVAHAEDAQHGLELLVSERPDAVFLDYRLPDGDGIAVLRSVRERLRDDAPAVVMLTAFAGSDNTIEAMKLGAFDHLTKPIGRVDVEAIVGRMLRRSALHPSTAAKASRNETLIGSSQAMREVQKLVGMAAASNATVLITGETGTGKELVARALHENSARAAMPFVAVNCAAIPADLLESELFGHRRGAFSGAVSDRVGRFRQANGGTLLLDEIGDMSLAMQAKILRSLQECEITPVGANRAEKVDVRIIAATHVDLPEAVRSGRFREDLFYRLNVVPIHLPPLRERPSDIVVLAEHFLAESSQRRKALSTAAARMLLTHSWPGNVRELKNLMERLSVIGRGSVVDAEDFAALMGAEAGSARDGEAAADRLSGDLPSAVARLEREMIRRALAQSGGNRAEAARRLGIHRQFLYAKIKEHGIE